MAVFSCLFNLSLSSSAFPLSLRLTLIPRAAGECAACSQNSCVRSRVAHGGSGCMGKRKARARASESDRKKNSSLNRGETVVDRFFHSALCRRTNLPSKSRERERACLSLLDPPLSRRVPLSSVSLAESSRVIVAARGKQKRGKAILQAKRSDGTATTTSSTNLALRHRRRPCSRLECYRLAPP